MKRFIVGLKIWLAMSIALVIVDFPCEALTKEKKTKIINFGIGSYIAPNMDNFAVIENTPYGWKKYSIQGKNLPELSLSVRDWFAKDTGIQCGYNFGIGRGINMQVADIIGLYKIPFRKDLTPYLMIGFCEGFFKCNDLPGSFEKNTGLEVGVGIEIIRERFILTPELLYRDIEFDYNKPSNIITGSSKLNAKGITFGIGILKKK